MVESQSNGRIGRRNDEMRRVEIVRHFTKHAEGSVLIKFGETQVLCTASVVEGVPGFCRGQGHGWLTAEYGMLPRSTHTRSDREAAKGKQSGRTQEIQRLIGRSLRASLDLKVLGERTITIDCDVLQADGGTRTAAITGGYIALVDAIRTLQAKSLISAEYLPQPIAAISVGVVNGEVRLDLDYSEDSNCDTDMNIVGTVNGGLIEVQGTAEGGLFDRTTLNQMIDYAELGIGKLIIAQMDVLR